MTFCCLWLAHHPQPSASRMTHPSLLSKSVNLSKAFFHMLIAMRRGLKQRRLEHPQYPVKTPHPIPL